MCINFSKFLIYCNPISAIEESQSVTRKSKSSNLPKPEIKHVFKEPEKRPPTLVSTAFTMLCVLPLFVCFLIWMRLGVNISSLPFSIAAIGFYLGFASIFLLYGWFWLQLRMFDTIKYLIMLGVATFLCGNSLLRDVAQRRKSGTN